MLGAMSDVGPPPNASGAPAVRSIYLTFPDAASARSLASRLLEARLIACANVFPAGTSLFRWEGRVVDEAELVMICKTCDDRLEALTEVVEHEHPYDVPCVVALEAVGGSDAYLRWVYEETRPGPG